ncbi:SRPBCC family protein [Micromonospora sp. NBC_01796]|uniref:SRPBCC family protein n=1 Tax=Micromonospora sp. NBC_01796 TaxID=2975987 RepID=UPI002DDA91A8|nr:SRPBCC domain-containing protein [Micromonospora sp. NBC_01796]WSA85625.1 SRPBCC domain-containing protein [Micromonospora sp. NBC_01796]
MTETTSHSGQPTREFTITRVFDAPRALVFQAWTDPQHVARWFGPRGLTTPLSTIDMDVRPGGQWRLRMIGDEDGAEYPVVFACREVVAPERLVLAVPVPDDARAETEEALVTVTFADLGDKTEMTFHLAGIAAGPESAGLEEGWSSSFERMAEHLTGTSADSTAPNR